MRTILLVDDEQPILDALSHHVGWSELNMSIVGMALDGYEAYSKYKELKPDIIMTDVFMSGMDGIQLVQMIRKENPNIPIVILSGYEEFETARQAMRWGIDHFLLKPSSVTEIRLVMEEILQELDVIEQKKQLEEHYKREIDLMLPYSREKLFYEILTTRYLPEEIPQERLEYLEIPKPQEVLVVSLQITRPAFLTKLKERDWQLLKFGADNMIKEMTREELSLFPSIHGEVLDYSDHLFVISLLNKETNADLLYSTAETIARKIIEKIMTYLKIEASAGIGSIKQGLYELIDSYLESREALEFQESCQVYRFHEWNELHTTVDHFSPFMKQWNEALSLKDLDRATNSWLLIYEQLQSNSGGSLADVQTICVGLFSSLIYFWNDQFPLNQPPHTMSQFLQEIQKHYTLKQLASWMNEVITEWIRSAYQELSGRKSNRLVDSIKQYVEQNYMHEISFAAIAKELFVHPKYVSQLFKRVTGENFVSYLNNYRIHKAIDYLQSGQHMVYEVSEMVGFNNTTYFSQVFKMITGRSPSDYIKV
jgi:two-component system response regulator YesN